MSRRQSRVSIDVRQNDTLLEFENYKKKFLLANKHITKLNSTLSVRIEDLNAQISTLYVENLRLRASEIALATQLKKEREKSRKVMADAESAIQHFMKHLGYIRKSHNIPHTNPNSPQAQPAALRARRPVINPDATPPINRIARAPNIPGIHEEDEGSGSSNESPDGDPEDDGPPTSPTPPVRKKNKPRLSGSRLPLPTRASSPPLPPTPQDLPNLDFEDPVLKAGKRKPTRRQSGLLTTSMSITTITEVDPPRSRSPVLGSLPRQAAVLEEEEEEVLAVIGGIDGGEDEGPTLIAQSITRREKKKKLKEKDVPVEREHELNMESTRKEKKRLREGEMQRASQDGSRKSRLKDVTNSPPNSSPLPPLDTNIVDDRDCDVPTSATSTATASTFASTRTFLTTPATTPAPSVKASTEVPEYLITPRSSSPVPPAAEPSDLEHPIGGRERRVRKSINYAEPKLNTKMRKPDPPPSTSKRFSMSTSNHTTSTDSSSKPRTSLERPSSSSNSTSTSAEDAPPPTTSTIGVKRKKSRAHSVPDEDEDSDGAQADAEYGGLQTGWVNVEGRRRSVQSSRSTARYDGDDGRRHSIAI